METKPLEERIEHVKEGVKVEGILFEHEIVEDALEYYAICDQMALFCFPDDFLMNVLIENGLEGIGIQIVIALYFPQSLLTPLLVDTQDDRIIKLIKQRIDK